MDALTVKKDLELRLLRRFHLTINASLSFDDDGSECSWLVCVSCGGHVFKQFYFESLREVMHLGDYICDEVCEFLSGEAT